MIKPFNKKLLGAETYQLRNFLTKNYEKLPSFLKENVESINQKILEAEYGLSGPVVELKGEFLTPAEIKKFLFTSTGDAGWSFDSLEQWGSSSAAQDAVDIKDRFRVDFPNSACAKYVLSRPVDLSHEPYAVELTVLPGHALVTFIASRVQRTYPNLVTLEELAELLKGMSLDIWHDVKI